MIIKSKTISRSLVPIYRIYRPPTKTQITEPELFKQYKAGLIKRPLTFDEKCIIINDPKMIAHIELVEYGITFKPTRKLLVLMLLLGGVIGTYLYKSVPSAIGERYFSISQQSKEYWFGYFGGMFSFGSLWKVVMYVPAFVAVLTGSRYLKGGAFVVLMGLGVVGNWWMGGRGVERKLKGFEVWDRYRMVTGEYLVLSVVAAFLAMKAVSPMDLFNNLRLRLFFESRVGIGIVSAGIPIIVPLLVYFTYEMYQCYRKNNSSDLLLYYILSGIIYGLFRRKLYFKTS